MKKLLITIAIVFSCMLLTAQPIITRAQMLPFGSEIQFAQTVNFAVMDTTIQGANATWDFTTLQNADPSYVFSISITTPANTPYYASFPYSNYVQVERTLVSGVEQGLKYVYFNLTDTKMERQGMRSVYTSSSSNYSDPQEEYVFPLTYNTVNNDTWASDASTFGGEYNLKCIGYGTLKLPNATYNNVLMVRVNQTDLIEVTTYFWYKSDNYEILAGLYDWGFFGTQAIYATNITIDVNEFKQIASSIKHNNPVDNTLNIELVTNDVSQINYQIMNLSGIIVDNGILPVSASSSNQVKIDMSNLSTGMYFVSLSADNSGLKPEIIKVIKK